MSRWYQTPAGKALAAQEAPVLKRLLGDSFGHYLVQLGAPGTFDRCYDTGRIRRRMLICEQPDAVSSPRQTASQSEPPLIQARPEALPLANASVDALVLPHTLDFCDRPCSVLREVERVLIADGRVILIGFNPLSPWGLWRISPLARRQGLSGTGTHLTAQRVSDWLRLMGFELEACERIVSRLPPRPQRIQDPRAPDLKKQEASAKGVGDRRLREFPLLSRAASWLDRLESRELPIPAGVYLVRAVKRVPPLTPVGLPWWRTIGLVPDRAVEPSARVGGELRATHNESLFKGH